MGKPIPHLSSEQFHKCLKTAGKVDPEVILVKDYAPEIKVPDSTVPADARSVQFIISTGAVDRDGDTIDPGGWDLKSYQASGAILWAHDASQPPIAEPIAVWVEDNKLKAKCRFPEKEVYPFADTIYQLIKANVLRCTSVGFRPKAWVETDRVNDWGWPALDFKVQELLEFSIVSVPANPEAVVEAKSLGIDVGPYLKWAEQTLDTLNASGLLVPRNALEKTYFAGKGKSVTVPAGTVPAPAAIEPAAKVVELEAEVARLQTKAGRVLSQLNQEKLEAAIEIIQEVIDSAGSIDGGEDPAAASTHTNAKIPTSAIDAMLASMIDDALDRARGR